MAEPHYVSETQILRRVARDPACRWIFTRHAEDMTGERNKTAPDIQHALTNGRVTLHEQKRDLLWRVLGADVDGNRMEVVVAVYEDAIAIKVVTVF
jgi:hypothetical protein